MSDLGTVDGQPVTARVNFADETAVLIIGDEKHEIDAGTARLLAYQLTACADALDALADDSCDQTVTKRPIR